MVSMTYLSTHVPEYKEKQIIRYFNSYASNQSGKKSYMAYIAIYRHRKTGCKKATRFNLSSKFLLQNFGQVIRAT